MKTLRSDGLWIFAVLVFAAAWKAAILFWGVVPFNADEAVVGLMARHILSGERPVFFYGQAYMGSLDAFLVAACFKLFGQHVWCIRLVQSLLYLGTLATTVAIGREAFGSIKAGVLAALLLAFPTVNVTLYTTASLGGYGEALLLGNLILLGAFATKRHVVEEELSTFPIAWLGFWGFLVGIGLWANGLTMVYSVPAGLYLLWAVSKYRKAWLAPFFLTLAVGFLAGSLPWWGYAFSNGFDRLIMELFGTAVSVENTSWLVRTGNHALNFLLLGVSVIFGFRPPWSVHWLVWPMIPFVFAFWLAVLVFWASRFRNRSPAQSSYLLLGGVGIILLAGFLFTPFGVDPSGRYFLPLAVSLALIAAQMMMRAIQRGWQIGLLMVLVIAYQVAGTMQCALLYPPGLTTQFYEPTIIDHNSDQELMEFLLNEGETRGYSNYWVAYPIAFLSQEKLIFAPRLPYHLDLRYTPRDDRYAPYLAEVEKSPKTAYISTRNPQLDQHLRAQFGALGVSWQEKQIGDYHVYYHLSRAVHPQEIGLGELTQ